MKKLLPLLLCVLLLFTGCGKDTEADNPPAADAADDAPTAEVQMLLVGAIVDSEVVNIRHQASTDGRILDTARRGQMFEILDQTDGWCQVSYRGDIAYISASYLYQQEWQEGAQILLGVINEQGERANVRAAANTDAAVLLTAMKGEQFIVSQQDYSEGWHQVQYKGHAAYISADYLTVSETTIDQALFP